MLQSRGPFLDALIVTITEYWSEKGVWFTPRETAIIRWVEARLGSLHGRDKIRNSLKELVRTGILTRHKYGRWEVMYAMKPDHAWPGDPGYMDPWTSALAEPRFHVDAFGACWAYGTPLWRGGPRLYRLPKFPRPSEEFLLARARFHVRNAGLDPDHREIGMLVRRAIGEAALDGVRSFYGRTKPRSPARQHLETHTRFHPVIRPNPDLIAWRRQQRGKNRGRWRPEDDPWPYMHDILDALDRLCGAHEPLEQGAPFRPQDVCRELDGRIRDALARLLNEGTRPTRGFTSFQRGSNERLGVGVLGPHNDKTGPREWEHGAPQLACRCWGVRTVGLRWPSLGCS